MTPDAFGARSSTACWTCTLAGIAVVCEGVRRRQMAHSTRAEALVVLIPGLVGFQQTNPAITERMTHFRYSWTCPTACWTCTSAGIAVVCEGVRRRQMAHSTRAEALVVLIP